MTLPEILETYRRRAIEAAAVGASAPLASVYEAIVAELAPLAGENGTPAIAPAQADRWLTPAQVAGMLGTSVRWVYDHAEQLGGKRLSRRCLGSARRPSGGTSSAAGDVRSRTGALRRAAASCCHACRSSDRLRRARGA